MWGKKHLRSIEIYLAGPVVSCAQVTVPRGCVQKVFLEEVASGPGLTPKRLRGDEINSHSRSYHEAHCHSHATRQILSAKTGYIFSCFLGPKGRKVSDLVNHYDHSHAPDKI